MRSVPFRSILRGHRCKRANGLSDAQKPPAAPRRGGRGDVARRWTRLVVLLLSLIALPLGKGLAAPETQDVVVVITSPAEGSVVSGQVSIMGTATHPNFNSYGLLYAPGTQVTGGTVWAQESPIAWDVQSMVVNGVLGTWDTTALPNGQYVLALVVYEVGNGSPAQAYFVNNLTVSNEAATPTPEPTETPTPEGQEADPTQTVGEPPPAPTIQQPPTATPRPTATVSPDDVTGSEEENGEGGGGLPTDIFSVDAIKEAARLGVQLAFLLYAVGVLYVLAKAVIRYYLRQTRRKSSS